MNEMVPIVPMADIQAMAKTAVESRLFGVTDEKQALALMLICQAEGLHPMTAMRRYHIVQGRPAMRYEVMMADFQARGGKVHWINLGNDGKEARARFEINGQELEFSYTAEQAKAMGLSTKDNWKKQPDVMLRARCISGGLRLICPAVVSGIYTPEEVQFFDDKPQPVKSRGRKAASPPQEEKPVEARVEESPLPDMDAVSDEIALQLEKFRATAEAEGWWGYVSDDSYAELQEIRDIQDLRKAMKKLRNDMRVTMDEDRAFEGPAHD